ncbi:hypothetical protein BH18ACT4_BH18ACT4_04910 [soil metagenome]
MRVHELQLTYAFIVFDLDGAETAVGVTRLAPKVLVDGAQLLARSTTYAFATFGLRLGGASAGINARADGRDEAVAASVSEVTPLVEEKRWVTTPGVGLTEPDLAPLGAKLADPGLVAAGALAAAEAVVGSLDGRRVEVRGAGPAVDAAITALGERGALLVDAGADGDQLDVVLVAGKSGVVDHEAVAGIRARVVVPLTPVPITAKAFAAFGRAGAVVVPDFVSTAAPLLAAHDPAGGDPVTRVSETMAELAGADTGAWMAAAHRAEAFLETWQESLPFGRPLAF